jgi:hypothetical protein
MKNKTKTIFLLINLFLFLFFSFKLTLTQAETINSVCININTASEQDLEKLTGIGPVLAQKIIVARPFSSLDDLIKVSGVGQIKLAQIKEQNLACLQGQTFIPVSQPETRQIKTEEKQTSPIINIVCSPKNPVNKEIEIIISISNLKQTSYDLKIAIEKEKIISDIYNKNQDKWQSSHYYLNNAFSGNYFEKTFKLKIKEDYLTFQGQADLLIRIRENSKTSYFEFKDKINISQPEALIKKSIIPKKTAALAEKPLNLTGFWKNISASLLIAFFSGIIILILKKKMIN